MILVTPKAGAKHELLFNKPDPGLLFVELKLSLSFSLIVTFVFTIGMNLVTLCCI